jgi:hypothetical protein
LFYLCTEVYRGATLDDPRIVNMDPVHKLWMFENWQADQKEKAELAKNQAYLIGSFFNPEAVKSLIDENNNMHESTDEDFEESTNIVKNARLEANKPSHRRRRKLKA